ncbi:MAG: hypothetical protein IPO78_06145 [Saprospiraceae bacterium]|nr:hypothetical protein [Saprospiraceae bacterium]
MRRKHYVGFLFIFMSASIWAQNTADQYLKNYEARIKLERIDDVYIPKDLKDALKELDRLTDTKTALELISSSEDTIASKLHFNLGRWMQIHWGLEEGSRLSFYLKNRGLSFPDDMMDLLIRCWYRHLKQLPLDDQQLIDHYINQRQKEFQLRKANEPKPRIIKKS